MGLPHNIDHAARLNYLLGIGIPNGIAKHVLEYLDLNGPVFDQAGVDAKAARMFNALHTRSWAVYGSLESIVISNKGGRQGCKMGGVLFGADPMQSHTVIEVTFVDDTCVVIMWNSPSILVKAMNDLMGIIIDVFPKFHLTISFAKGKTECLLRLRGRKACEVKESLRIEGALAFQLPPPYSGERLRIVEHYKHLGSTVCLTESLVFDAQHRASSAMTSYVSLAGRVFGSRCIPSRIKLYLMTSLILSRLLYGTQLWCGNTVTAMRRINSVYMRVLRMILGDCRYGRCKYSEATVREILRQPSLDCLLLRRRFFFLGRIVATSHKSVLAVLSIR